MENSGTSKSPEPASPGLASSHDDVNVHLISSLNSRCSERFKAEKLRFTIPCRAGKYHMHFAEKQPSKGSVLRRWNLNPDPWGATPSSAHVLLT